jgi:hypothetical protein
MAGSHLFNVPEKNIHKGISTWHVHPPYPGFGISNIETLTRTDPFSFFLSGLPILSFKKEKQEKQGDKNKGIGEIGGAGKLALDFFVRVVYKIH